MEMRGIEPRAFHMQSERSTTELHPLHTLVTKNLPCNDTSLLVLQVTWTLRNPNLAPLELLLPLGAQNSRI